MHGKLNCPCGCGLLLDEGVVNILYSLEREIQAKYRKDFELYIASGARCEAYNKLQGGEPNSAHTLGLAADPLIENSQIGAIAIKFILNMFNPNKIRMGYGLKNGSIIFHFDLAYSAPLKYPKGDMKTYPAPCFWGY